MSDSFLVKYRPQSFGEMYGNKIILNQLYLVLAADHRPHTYLITGVSGIGKTSLARLIGNWLQAEITEIDAASHSGVDDMRKLVEESQYLSLQGADGNRMVIIDECHTLSKNAWQALLKLAEEPPDHFYLVLCTTEPGKVPVTIAGQRGYHIPLRPIQTQEMFDYLTAICAVEQWEVEPDVFTMVVQNAEGSPRRGLLLLLQAHEARDRNEVRRIVAIMDVGEPVMQLCQELLSSGQPTWQQLQPLVAKIEDDQFEGALVQMGRYFINCLGRGSYPKQEHHIFSLIEALTFPCETYDKKLQFYSVIARIIH